MLVLLVAGFVFGYFVRILRERSKPYQTIVVDETWVAEARSCWKGFASWPDPEILTKLSNAPSFRSAFPAYFSDTDLKISAVAKVAPALGIGPSVNWLPNDQKISPQEFGARVKAKYPEYADMSDLDVAHAVLKKFPVYADMLNDPYFVYQVPANKVYPDENGRPISSSPAQDDPVAHAKLLQLQKKLGIHPAVRQDNEKQVQYLDDDGNPIYIEPKTGERIVTRPYEPHGIFTNPCTVAEGLPPNF